MEADRSLPMPDEIATRIVEYYHKLPFPLPPILTVLQGAASFSCTEAVNRRMLAPLLLFWALVAGEETNPNLAWGDRCPVACSCHLGHFGDLPVNQWLQKDELKVPKPPISVTNEVLYEEDANKDEGTLHAERGELLKIAMCIFQSSSDPQKLLYELPKDTQALTLLQSRRSEEITLEAEHMRRFQQLVYFDIQGYCPEVWQEESHENFTDHHFMLSNDVLRPLVSLQYLSLQHIKLLGSSMKSNEIDHEGHSPPQLEPHQNEITLNLHTRSEEKKRRHSKTPPSNLIVLKPKGTEGDLVPYQVYKEQQERARLSIFAKLSNLLLLRVIDCGLHDVYWEMFEGLRKLQHLALEKNQLLFLPEFAFYGTPSLKTLSLAHNKLLNIHSTGLAGLLELQKLDLSYNNFSHLSEFSLPPFPKLKEAYFWHNPIEAVFASTFEIMNATTILYLGGNNSSLTLHPNSFQGLNNLKKLVLYNVGIEVLEREQLSGMPQMRYLKLSGTITSISFDAFLDAPLLETLDLQYCNIKSVSMDAFYGLYRLGILDLSNNLLESLPPGVFDQQFSLKELYLQNNSLTDLPDGFFTNLSAKMVRLEGNPWHCTCNMKSWLPSSTNRVKQLKTERSTCENDKCSPSTQGISYVYEKKVAPRCVTPSEYKGWSVYHVLRKELGCSKPVFKKFNRREYFRKKYREYERSNALDINPNPSNHTEPSKVHYSALKNNTNGLNIPENNTLLKKSTLSSHIKQLDSEKTNQTIYSKPSASLPVDLKSTNEISETNNNTDSPMSNNEQDKFEDNLPLIHTTQKQNSLQYPEAQVQPQSNTLTPVAQQDINLAADINRKPGQGSLSMSNSMKLQSYNETHETRFVKKLRKTELLMKHQEKMKNQTRV